MYECSMGMKQCYSQEEFDKFTEQSYEILAKVLVKFEADFTLDQCEDLATPVPLTALMGGANAMSWPNMTMLMCCLFTLLFLQRS